MTASDSPAPVRLEGRAVVIDAGPVAGRRALFGGSLHYSRLEPRRWARALAGMRALGFTFVDTAAPWSVHERGPGRFDFTGPRDLGAFLDACAGEGLPVLLRVGPRVAGEFTFQGLPERIVADPAMLQRTNQGHPAWTLEPPRGWPMPSYASPKFLTEVAALYRALGEVVGPRLAPDGAVALLQLDHELGGFLRSGPFCGDYHPAAVARFVDEYGGRQPPRALPRPLPERPDQLAPLLEWMAFRERQIGRALTELSRLADEAGLTRSVPGAARGALRLCGFPALPPETYDVAEAERVVDAASVAVLDAASDHQRTAARARYLGGSSRFPLCSPLGVGSFAWGPSRGADDGVAALLGALGHGAVGHSLFAAVTRDRWIGAPLDDEGRPVGAAGAAVQKIHQALHRADWVGLSGPATVGLLVPREYARLDLATSPLGPMGPLASWAHFERGAPRQETFGFAGPIQRERHAVVEALRAALQQAGLAWVELDGSAGAERLRALPLLVAVTFDFLDEEVLARLRAYGEAGGRLLWGPRAPAPLAALQQERPPLPGEQLDPAQLADLGALAARLARLAGAGPTAAEAPSPRGAEGVVVHRRADGRPALLFVEPAPPAPPAPAGAERHGAERPGPTGAVGAARSARPMRPMRATGAAAASARPAAPAALARLEVPDGLVFVDVLSGERFTGPALEIARGPLPRLLAAEPNSDTGGTP